MSHALEGGQADWKDEQQPVKDGQKGGRQQLGDGFGVPGAGGRGAEEEGGVDEEDKSDEVGLNDEDEPIHVW